MTGRAAALGAGSPQRDLAREPAAPGLRPAGDDVLLLLDVSWLLPVPDTSPTFPARVFAKVDASGDCWEWTGALNPNGYGTIGRGGRGTGNIAAHRAVWELLVGPIEPDMHYDHLCRNRRCVNPGHGEIVEPAENKRRGYSPAVLYSLRTTCDKGHPLDGVTGGRGSARRHRYCKTCAREKTRLRRDAGREAA